MSALKATLTAAMKDAMRSKSSDLGTIRLILAEIKQVEVDKRIELTDADVLAILDKMKKQRQDSIAQFTKAERLDLVETETAELAIIQGFLPQQLTEAEIDAKVQAALESVQPSGMQDMGKVMAILKPELQGRADLGRVSAVVKAQITAS